VATEGETLLENDDRRVLRDLLATRANDCWERLSDAICELRALHGVTEDEIVERARAAAVAEASPAASQNAHV
jgi:hypothetical protein